MGFAAAAFVGAGFVAAVAVVASANAAAAENISRTIFSLLFGGARRPRRRRLVDSGIALAGLRAVEARLNGIHAQRPERRCGQTGSNTPRWHCSRRPLSTQANITRLLTCPLGAAVRPLGACFPWRGAQQGTRSSGMQHSRP